MLKLYLWALIIEFLIMIFENGTFHYRIKSLQIVSDLSLEFKINQELWNILDITIIIRRDPAFVCETNQTEVCASVKSIARARPD